MPAELSRNGDGPPDAIPGDGVGIHLRGVGKRFGEIVALRGIDFEIPRHSRIGIVGPSGGGKSTLLHIVAGLMEPDTGEVNVEGATAAKDRLARCALMPQRDGLLPWLSALDNAGLALRVAGASKQQARAAARPYFEPFGLAGFEDARPAALSSGMRQRVAFLRTLLAGRPVLCLDEPFGALDALTRLQMQAWLADALAREPRTVLLVTHDVEEAVVLADRVVVLSPRPGRVVAELEVPSPRPRQPTDPDVVALRAQALEALRT